MNACCIQKSKKILPCLFLDFISVDFFSRSGIVPFGIFVLETFSSKFTPVSNLYHGMILYGRVHILSQLNFATLIWQSHAQKFQNFALSDVRLMKGSMLLFRSAFWKYSQYVSKMMF